MFKMWKRWAYVRALERNVKTTWNDGPGIGLAEVVLRVESDDKKMRDVFEAAMKWHELGRPGSHPREDDIHDADWSVYEACERAKQ